MKILVLGGTRLLGLALVNKLVSAGHDVTVVSRRNDRLPETVRSIVAERSSGLQALVVKDFDIVFDFLAYHASEVNEVLDVLGRAAYFLISSTWITRLGSAYEADQLVESPEPEASGKLLPVTREYLLGKNDAEKAVVTGRRAGHRASVLRMPIFWGSHDHTGRMAFYASRILDGNPIILVDGGANLTQIAWVEDIASALEKSVPWLADGERCVWECLPHSGVKLKEVIENISGGLNTSVVLFDISERFLRKRLPAYLDVEPLWRETVLKLTDANLFSACGITPHAQSDWLPRCAALQSLSPDVSLRRSELALIKELSHA